MFSPFPYDKISNSDSFFGRNAELKTMSKIIKYSNNILIHSKKRMGKSSLINNFIEKNKEEYLYIYVDIFDITSKEDFAYSLLKALTNSQEGDLKVLSKL